MTVVLALPALAGVPPAPRSAAPLLVDPAEVLAHGLAHVAAVRGRREPVEVEARQTRVGLCCSPLAVVVRGDDWTGGVFVGPDGEDLGLVDAWRDAGPGAAERVVLPGGPTPATALRAATRAFAALADDDDVLVAAPAPGGFDVWAVRPEPDAWAVVAHARVDPVGAVSGAEQAAGVWTPAAGAAAAAVGALRREAAGELGLWTYRPRRPPEPPTGECPPPPPATCRQPTAR